MAGLWERWEDPDGEAEPLETFAILTRLADEVLAPIHDRMPVLLDPDAYAPWLDPDLRDPADLDDLLRAPPAIELVPLAVSTRVNSPAHDDPACLEPLS